jgi:hypothetical protein
MISSNGFKGFGGMVIGSPINTASSLLKIKKNNFSLKKKSLNNSRD